MGRDERVKDDWSHVTGRLRLRPTYESAKQQFPDSVRGAFFLVASIGYRLLLKNQARHATFGLRGGFNAACEHRRDVMLLGCRLDEFGC